MADITITEGDTLEVDYNLENTGDGTGTFDPRLLVQGVQEDQDTGITLDPAQTATGTLQWPTESGDAVTDGLAEAVTDDTSDSITVTVEAIPDSGVSRWTFDNADTESGTAVDVSGNNDGTINGATTGASGANQTYTTNEAYSFDGVNDYVQIGASDGTQLDFTGSFSVAAWIFTPVGADGNTYAIYNRAEESGEDSDPRFGVSDGKIRMGVGNAGTSTFQTVTSSTTVADGVWRHVVGVFDDPGDTMSVYVDSSLDGENTSATVSPRSYSETPLIGAYGGAVGLQRFWDGQIDDLRIYDKALTSTEVSDLYNTGSI